MCARYLSMHFLPDQYPSRNYKLDHLSYSFHPQALSRPPPTFCHFPCLSNYEYAHEAQLCNQRYMNIVTTFQ